MPARIDALVQPRLLRWARETAALQADDLARKLSVPESEVKAWEAGKSHPSVAQLKEFAGACRRPLAAFYLPKPPDSVETFEDFRAPSHRTDPSPGLLFELRRARRRRAIALELLKELAREPSLLPEPPGGLDAEALAAWTRDLLGVSLHDQFSWSRRSRPTPLDRWISAVERLDVLVFQSSRVGLDEMRGFSLSGLVLPVTALNGKDYAYARIFTLMHELAHVVLRLGGVCDLTDRTSGASPSAELETRCNRVAGAILVPRDALHAQPEVEKTTKPRDWEDQELQRLAARFNVSREVMLRRLLYSGKTTRTFYERMRALFVVEYARIREPRKGGPAPQDLALRDNGRRFTALVLDAYKRDTVAAADASEYLGLRAKHFPELQDRLAHTA